MLKQETAVVSRRRPTCRGKTRSHPRGLTRKRRPLYSARFATLASIRSMPRAPVAELVDALD